MKDQCRLTNKKEDKPEPNKLYSLTGTGKSIANGNTWAESEVAEPEPPKLSMEDRDKLIKELFNNIIELSDYFVEDYEPSAEECIGISLAHNFDWDSRIVETCIRALEDANFHTEAGMLAESIND